MVLLSWPIRTLTCRVPALPKTPAFPTLSNTILVCVCIFRAKLMPVLAMCFEFALVLMLVRCPVPIGVFLASQRLKMRRVHTSAIPTLMVNIHLLWNFSIRQLVSNSGSGRFGIASTMQAIHAIPRLAIYVRCPWPTIVRPLNIDLGPEPLNNSVGRLGAHPKLLSLGAMLREAATSPGLFDASILPFTSQKGYPAAYEKGMINAY